MNIAIYIYDQAEVLDFSGPFEVFSTAKRLGAAALDVFLIAEHLTPVIARGGLQVLPQYSFSEHPNIDLLIVVGGDHSEEVTKQQVIGKIADIDNTSVQTASVCTGAFILAQAGLLTQQTVTTHWEDIPDLAQQYPLVNVVDNQRWVKSGKYITSGGISAGIDMSLHLVSEHCGEAMALKVAKQMEYRWQR